MNSLTVLVVDDQPIMREVVAQFLEDAGHTVRIAWDGWDALRKLDNGRYDLMVTDIVMPGIDGIELIAEVRRRHPELRIIAMSAGGGAFQKADCLAIAARMGAGMVLTKPFDSDDLAGAIHDLCAADTLALG